MLKLSQILAVLRTVGPCGRSPVADVAATCWGLPPGSARYFRSSASHVFAVDAGADVGACFLRLVPEDHRSLSEVRATTDLMTALALAGLPVARPVRSPAGRTVEVVQTEAGLMSAVLLPKAAGTQLEVEDLDDRLAFAWGAHLGRLHTQQPGPVEPLPERWSWFHDQQRLDLPDEEANEAFEAVRAHLAGSSDEIRARGLVHGDLELDNVRWAGLVGTSYDYDDAGCGPLLLDLAAAARDLQDHPSLRTAFLAGYRSERQLTDAAAAALPLFRGLLAARQLQALRDVVDVDPTEALPGEDWLPHLVKALEAHRTTERALLLREAAGLSTTAGRPPTG